MAIYYIMIEQYFSYFAVNIDEKIGKFIDFLISL